MTDREPTARCSDAALDALLAQPPRRPPDPLPERLRARLLAEALAQMPPPAPAPRRVEGRGGCALWQALGGAPGMAGMTPPALPGSGSGRRRPSPWRGSPRPSGRAPALVSPDLAALADDARFGFEPTTRCWPFWAMTERPDHDRIRPAIPRRRRPGRGCAWRSSPRWR
jgi:hypothetical protein